jgi:alpha-1,6-mannosyltransferase
MSARRWQVWGLTAIGTLMLLLTGAGLTLQRGDAHEGFVAVALIQGVLYLVTVALTWRGGFPRRVLVGILAVAALMRLGILLAPPYLSNDLYRYVWDGRVEAAGINPYRYVPSDTHLAALRDETIYPNINRRTYAPTIYPPAAELIFLLTTRISESVTWMKATMVAFDFTSIAILVRLLVLGGLPLERIVIYAWHPLVLWEFAGSGHIDAAIVTFVALALWARRRETAWLTGIALAAAVLVKFFPAVIFPALYRRWDWKMPAAAAATLIAGYLPFLAAGRGVLGFLPGYVREEGLNSGAGFFLWNLLRAAVPAASTSYVPYLIFAAAVLASLGICVMLSDRAGDRYVASAGGLAAAFTVLLSPHYPWYFAWIVAFLCFMPAPSVLYLSVASLLLYFVSGGPDLDGGRMLIEAAIYGPFAVLAVLELWRRRTAKPRPGWIRAEV